MQYNQNTSRQETPRPGISGGSRPAPDVAAAESALLKSIQATWDHCARSCPNLTNPAQRNEAERLVGEILRKTGAWRSDGLSGILHRGAVDIVSHQPKSTLNITARALDVFGRIALIRGKSDEATQFFKCAVGVSAAPREVIGSFVDDTRLALTRASDQDAERMKVFALEALCRHLETGPRIVGEQLEASLLRAKPQHREQAQWALLQTAEFANSLGVTATLKSHLGEKERRQFELTCRCGRNSLRLSGLPADLGEGYNLATGAAPFNPAPLGISDEARKHLARTVYLAADAYRHLGSPAGAFAGFAVSEWLLPVIPDAKLARAALRDANPGLESRVVDELKLLAPTQPTQRETSATEIRIEKPGVSRTPSATITAGISWVSEITAGTPWAEMRLAPGAVLGWDHDRLVQNKLLEARMALGERSYDLLSDQRLRDFAHDLAVLAQLPASHLSAYPRYVQTSLAEQSAQTSARFVDLLQMEATLGIYFRLPAAHTPLRSESERIRSACERESRQLHKPLAVGSVHGPILKVLQVLVDWRSAQVKKRP